MHWGTNASGSCGCSCVPKLFSQIFCPCNDSQQFRFSIQTSDFYPVCSSVSEFAVRFSSIMIRTQIFGRKSVPICILWGLCASNGPRTDFCWDIFFVSVLILFCQAINTHFILEYLCCLRFQVPFQIIVGPRGLFVKIKREVPQDHLSQ